MTINDRFQEIIQTLFGGNKRAFSKAIGINPTVTENIVGSRRGKPSYDLLCKVCSNANISEAWLLTGKGDMLQPISGQAISHITSPISDVAKCSEPQSSMSDVSIPPAEFRPRIPIDAAAGALSIAINSISAVDCEMLPLIPRFPKYDFTIIAKGDSMTPEISSGDELACRFIDQNGFIQWGRPHVLDTAQGVVVKRIFEHADKVICRSTNSDYPDFTVPKEDIYHIALVVGLVRQY